MLKIQKNRAALALTFSSDAKATSQDVIFNTAQYRQRQHFAALVTAAFQEEGKHANA